MDVLMRWLHMGGMAMVAAGTVFARLALGPAPLADEGRDRELLARIGPAWRMAIWVALATGVYNLFHLRPRPMPDVRPLYATVIAVKIALVVGLVTIIFGVTTTSPRPGFWHRRRSLLSLGVVLATAIVGISAFLRSLR